MITGEILFKTEIFGDVGSQNAFPDPLTFMVTFLGSPSCWTPDCLPRSR
jgi:hypothetical protein